MPTPDSSPGVWRRCLKCMPFDNIEIQELDNIKQRIYIDTSVIGGCKDEEFSRWSIQLFEEFQQGLKIAVISNLTRRELEGAPESVKKILLSFPDINVENVFFNEAAETLA